MKNLMALMLLAVSGNLLAADSAQTCTSVLTDQNGNEVSAFAFKDSCTDANYSCLNTLSEKLANGDILAGNCVEDSFRGPGPGPGPRPGPGPGRPPGGGVGPGPGPRPPSYPAPGPGPGPRPPSYPGPAPRPPHYPVPGPGPRPPGYPVPPPPPIYQNCTVDMVNAYNNMLIRRYWETAPSRYSACNQALSRCEFDRRYQYEPTRCYIAY